MAEAVPLTMKVNGDEVRISVEPNWSLADVLREELQLTGTHLGCEHGVCGACTVLLDGEPVRSCLLLGPQANGHEVETVEGLSVDGVLNPLQDAFRRHHGLQCGFCTPGFLMAATALVTRDRDLVIRDGHVDREAVRQRLSGNLCRCTGYTGIIDAVIAVLEQSR